MKSLQSKISFGLASVVVIIVATTAILVQHEVSNRTIESETQHAQEIADLTLMTISNEYHAYTFHRESLLRERRQTIKNHMSLIFAYIEYQYRRFDAGLITDNEAKSSIIGDLKGLRYDNGIGYFWINDCTQPIPKMIMHPTIPDLDGTILDKPEFHCAVGTNENLFTVFVDTCLKNGEGFVEYYWPKPTPDGLTQQQPKISFVKLFEKWDWIIGTGVYIDDIEKECQANFNKMKESMFKNLEEIKIAQSGYIFIVSGDDKMQLHPQLKGSDASSLYNPITNMKMTDEIKNAVQNGKYIFDYLWSKPGEPEENQYVKTAYIRYFEPLDWYIVISVYKDELLAPAASISSKIIWTSLVFLFLATLLSIALGRSISRPITSLARAAKKIENEGIENTTLPIKGSTETQTLGSCLQSMVDTLQQEQEKLHMQSFLVESAASPIVMSDMDGKLTYANPAFLLLWGYDFENEVVGRNINNFWEVTDTIEHIRQSIKENGHLSQELQATRKDNSHFPIKMMAAIVYDKENIAVAMMYSPVDISEQKHAEDVIKNYNISLQAEVQTRTEELVEKNVLLEKEIKERKRTENELKTATSQLIQTEKMATIGQLAAGVAHEINTPLGAINSSCSTLEKQFADIINNLDTEFAIYSDNRELIKNMISQITSSKSEFSSRQLRERKNALSRKLTALGIENPESAAAALTNICPDEDCDHCINIFEQNNSQEILSFLQRISDIVHGIRIIDKAIKQSSRVIFVLKDYARSEIHQKMIVADVKDTIDTAIVLYGNKIKHGVELKLDLQDTPEILCHPHELCQIWTNLISNAIHAMNNQGTLSISLNSDEKNIFITFADTGSGIPGRIRDKIFEPMFTTKPKGEGTGLGLDIVKRILNRHSGSISFETKPEKGTTFLVTIPITKGF